MTLRYNRINTTIYTDTLFSKIKSLKGNKCAQLFANEDYVKVIPTVTESQAGRALQEFVEDVGVLINMVVDGAQAQVGRNSDFQQLIRKYSIKFRVTEPYSTWPNNAEKAIGQLKKKWKSRMTFILEPLDASRIMESTMRVRSCPEQQEDQRREQGLRETQVTFEIYLNGRILVFTTWYGIGMFHTLI